MMSSYYFRQRIPPELRAEIDRANAERAAIIHRAISRLTDGAIVVTEALIAGIHRLHAAWHRHGEEIRAFRELSALSDRSLKDIGIERGQIREAVRGQLEHGRRRRERAGTPTLTTVHGPGPARAEEPEELRECA